eukprot:2281568-Pyramimonas_sp.AAC.1
MSCLSERGVQVFIYLLWISECLAEPPPQLQWVLMALLPAASKGYRTIGIFSMFYRVSGKIRLSYARAWMGKFDHPWFSCGPGRSPSDVVWRQRVRSEASKASGDASAGLFWDLVSLYERFVGA